VTVVHCCRKAFDLVCVFCICLQPNWGTMRRVATHRLWCQNSALYPTRLRKWRLLCWRSTRNAGMCAFLLEHCRASVSLCLEDCNVTNTSYRPPFWVQLSWASRCVHLPLCVCVCVWSGSNHLNWRTPSSGMWRHVGLL
jgi:hypothetical protein